MKHFVAFFLLANLLLGCKGDHSTISGTATSYDSREIYLAFDGQQDTALINVDGTFSVELKISRPTGVILQAKELKLNLYLEPRRNLVITIDGQSAESSVKFSGDMALPARYLYEKARENEKSQKLFYPYYQPPKTPGDFKSFRDSLAQNQFAFLEGFKKANSGLSKNFYKREKLAILYALYTDWYAFPRIVNPANREQMNIPSDWYSFLDNVNLEDPNILDISEGKWFVTYYVALEAAKRGGISFDDMSWNPNWIREAFNYVKDYFPYQEFYNEIPHYFLTYYIENDRMGTVGIEDLVTEYLSKSTDETLKNDIKLLCDKWAPIATGMPAPDFTLPDVNGNNVSLSDYKGKYVVIDFWFTGCGSCKVMFPYLKQLMNEYRNRNIIFISISVDAERSAWEKMLKEGYDEAGTRVFFEEKANWIHLHDPQTRAIAKQYLVSKYPTYILIDRDGKYASSRIEYPKRLNKIRALLDAQAGL